MSCSFAFVINVQLSGNGINRKCPEVVNSNSLSLSLRKIIAHSFLVGYRTFSCFFLVISFHQIDRSKRVLVSSSSLLREVLKSRRAKQQQHPQRSAAPTNQPEPEQHHPSKLTRFTLNLKRNQSRAYENYSSARPIILQSATIPAPSSSHYQPLALSLTSLLPFRSILLCCTLLA